MSAGNNDVLPELKQILGAMIFGANRPLSVKEILKCLKTVAETDGGETSAFGTVDKNNVAAALEELKIDIDKLCCGFVLEEVAGGFRFLSDVKCGKWLKNLLGIEKRARLSQPAMETLAIIAYRQPITRAEIESVRGVSIDHMIKVLMEMQLVRIIGRSDLPGRPFIYGTTHVFLEHFGLKDLNELEDMRGIFQKRMLMDIAEKNIKQSSKDTGDNTSNIEPPEEEVQVIDVGDSDNES